MDNLLNYDTILVNTGYLVLYFCYFFLAKWAKGLVSSYNLDEQLTEYDNNAVSVSVVGYFIGITIIFIGALIGPSSGELALDFLAVGGYALAGMLLLQVSRLVNEKVILPRFSVDKEIVKDQNAGTGVIEAGVYIASAMVIAGAIHGEGGGPITALVFYALGQVALIIFGLIYTRLTPYNVHSEIEKDNVAAGLGFAGGLIALGIIIMRAVSGPFQGWVADLSLLGIEVVVVLVYLAGVRLIFDRFVLRKSNLATEIAEDQNLGAGLLEMFVAICFAVVLFFLL